MFNNRIDIFEENKRLREELEHERRLRKQWQERCLRLETKVKLLEATLNRILNPNTPSSQIPDTEKCARQSPNRKQTGSKPRGKPQGGNGGARAPPKNIDQKKTQYSRDALIAEAMILITLKQRNAILGICHSSNLS